MLPQYKSNSHPLSLSLLPPTWPLTMPKGHGTNSQGNSYNTPGGSNSSAGSSYHYSNSNSSYYYANDNGSTYYNPGSSGAGSTTYTAPSSTGGSSQGSASKKWSDILLSKATDIVSLCVPRDFFSPVGVI